MRSQLKCYSVWFQHYRKENFHDDSLPAGKWTKRESKQNWVGSFYSLLRTSSYHNTSNQRITYLQTVANRSPILGPIKPSSGYSSPSRSGAQTPREVREEKWRLDAEGESRPTKNEMREMYKELGGRKARGKTKLGGSGSTRDRGGWSDYGGGESEY